MGGLKGKRELFLQIRVRKVADRKDLEDVQNADWDTAFKTVRRSHHVYPHKRDVPSLAPHLSCHDSLYRALCLERVTLEPPLHAV